MITLQRLWALSQRQQNIYIWHQGHNDAPISSYPAHCDDPLCTVGGRLPRPDDSRIVVIPSALGIGYIAKSQYLSPIASEGYLTWDSARGDTPRAAYNALLRTIRCRRSRQSAYA